MIWPSSGLFRQCVRWCTTADFAYFYFAENPSLEKTPQCPQKEAGIFFGREFVRIFSQIPPTAHCHKQFRQAARIK